MTSDDMNFEDEGGDNSVEESLEESPVGGKLKRLRKNRFADGDPEAMIKSFYGEGFDGTFMKIDELTDLLPAFKDFYFAAKRADMNGSSMKIVRDFNAKISPERFYPYPSQYKRWRKRWDRFLAMELGYEERQLVEAKRINEVVKVRDAERAMTLVPGEEELESGVKTLGGMLINDAVSMLQDDKEMEDMYSSDELVKRKMYVLNVFAHVTRNVQGKENLRIKKQAENRETANFLINILNRAKSGKMSVDDIDALKASAAPQPATTTP